MASQNGLRLWSRCGPAGRKTTLALTRNLSPQHTTRLSTHGPVLRRCWTATTFRAWCTVHRSSGQVRCCEFSTTAADTDSVSARAQLATEISTTTLYKSTFYTPLSHLLSSADSRRYHRFLCPATPAPHHGYPPVDGRDQREGACGRLAHGGEELEERGDRSGTRSSCGRER
jgi:hypothetical protein